MKKVFLIIFLFLNSIVLCSLDNYQNPLYIDLKGDWLFSEDNGETFNSRTVPFLERNLNTKTILKKKFLIEGLSGKDLILRLGKIDDDAVVFLNGVKVSERETSWNIESGFSTRFYEERFFHIPQKILKYENYNEIKILLFNYSGFGGIVGENIAIYDMRSFIKESLPLLLRRPDISDIFYYMLIGVFFAFAMMLILNFAYYKENISDLYLFVLITCFIVFIYTGLIDSVKVFWSHYNFFAKISSISLIVSIVFFTLFLENLFIMKKNIKQKIPRIVIIIYNSLLSAAILFLPLKYNEPIFSFFIITLSLELLYFVYLLHFSALRKSIPKSVQIGILIWILTAIYDIFYYFRLLDFWQTHLSGYGYFLFLSLVTVSRTKYNMFLIANEENMEIKNRDSNERQINISLMTKLDKVINYINNNFKSDMSREGLASLIDLAPDYFGKVFKIYTGEKLNTYIKRIRIDYALDRLKNTDLSIIDIAMESGFESLRTFNRAFQEIHGLTPSNYRKSI